jgi:hypothetical protein
MEWNRYLAREWPGCLVGPDMDVVPFLDSHPIDAGVYFAFSEDEQLLYIGQSLGIQYRMTQHYWGGKRWATYGAVAVPVDLFRPIETAYIHALTPPLNRQYLRPEYPELHERIVAAIQDRWGGSDWRQ